MNTCFRLHTIPSSQHIFKWLFCTEKLALNTGFKVSLQIKIIIRFVSKITKNAYLNIKISTTHPNFKALKSINRLFQKNQMLEDTLKCSGKHI